VEEIPHIQSTFCMTQCYGPSSPTSVLQQHHVSVD